MVEIGNLGLQVAPASVDTKTEAAPVLATPTKMRGVAVPEVPEVVSKVIQAIPMMSLL